MGQEMPVLALLGVAALLLGGFISLRGAPPSRDRRQIEQRYRLKGVPVLEMKFLGRDRPLFGSWPRSIVRKYSVEIEMPDGGRETRIIGIEETLGDEPKLWSYDRDGDRHSMF
jgi:hypothetical protein